MEAVVASFEVAMDREEWEQAGKSWGSWKRGVVGCWEGNGRESGREAVNVYVEVRIDTCTHLHHRLLSLLRETRSKGANELAFV